MPATVEQRSPRVIVSVLNWNQFELTVECLRSLEQITYPDFKVVVVDNGSRTFPEDGSLSKFPAVDVVRSASNLGYAGAHKLVADRAVAEGFDLIWLLNNDVLVRPDTLSELVDAYRRCGKGIYGSIQLLPDPPDQLAQHLFWEVDGAGRPNFSRNLLADCRTYDDLLRRGEGPQPVAWVSGSSMLVPLSIVRRHGFISESFFLYGEEADYCLRLGREGVPSMLVPRSVIWHDHMTSSRDNTSLSNMLYYYRIRNAHIVARRYRTPREYLRFLSDEIRRQVRGLLFAARYERRTFRRSSAYFRCLGLWDALRGRMGKRFAPEDFL